MKHLLRDIIAVVNNKGGVGKTTTVHSISSALMRREKEIHVLMVDMDPQGDLTKLCSWSESGPTVYDALCREAGLPIYKDEETGLYFCPSSPRLEDVDLELGRKMQPNMALIQCFAKPCDSQTGEDMQMPVDFFDYILIDCPPALSRVTYNALGLSNSVIIPVQMEGLSVSGVGAIIEVIARVRKGLNQDIELKGLLPVMVDKRTNATKELMRFLPEYYGDLVTKHYIRRSTKMIEAQNRRKDIFHYAPYCPAAVDYGAVVDELFPPIYNNKEKK